MQVEGPVGGSLIDLVELSVFRIKNDSNIGREGKQISQSEF